MSILVPHNLVADAGYPLLTETKKIGGAVTLEWGSVVALDPATDQVSLITATNMAQLFGVTRDTAKVGEAVVVYVSGAFIADTLKYDAAVVWADLKKALRDLGIYARVSVEYPSDVAMSPPSVQAQTQSEGGKASV